MLVTTGLFTVGNPVSIFAIVRLSMCSYNQVVPEILKSNRLEALRNIAVLLVKGDAYDKYSTG